MNYSYPEYSLSKIGSLLKQQRERKIISIETISNQFGISIERYRLIEDGRAALSFNEIAAVSEFLSIPLNDITNIISVPMKKVYFRTDVSSNITSDIVRKAQNIFCELIGQAQLRS